MLDGRASARARSRRFPPRAPAIASGLAAVWTAAAIVGATAVPPRRAAAEDSSVEQAIADLGKPEWPDRVAAVYALQRAGRGAAPAAPALYARLFDDNGLVRFEAAEALKRIGAPAVPYLVRGLDAGDAGVRLSCARTLGRIGRAALDALPRLERSAAAEEDLEVRGAAALAASLIAPRGAAGWLRKVLFEVQDEPAGPLWLMGAFGALVLLVGAWRAVGDRTWRAAPVPAAADGPEGELDAGDREDDETDEQDADGAERAAEGVAEDAAEDAAECDGLDHGVEADGAAAPPEAGGTRKDRPLRGVPHALAGLASIAVGVLVVAVFGRNPDVDERHATYLFASAWMLFGLGFVRYGLAGAIADQRARRRAAAATELWLRDREWSRDGTAAIGAVRVLPGLGSLAVLLAYLTPFHTIWRLPFSWWGAWLALGALDLLAAATVVVVAKRAWDAARGGRCRLRWTAAPIAPGERLRAQFASSRTIAASGPAIVTLRCLRDGDGAQPGSPDPSPDADELYAEARSFPVHARPAGGSWIDVDFAIPADARGTSSLSARPVRWVLALSIPTAGPDFTTAFPVPVYRSRHARAASRQLTSTAGKRTLPSTAGS